MAEYICFVCATPFKRVPSQVRKPDEVCCSKACVAIKLQSTLTGRNNPNFRHGKTIEPSICECGREKDFRSRKCSMCANVGFSKIGESRYDETEILEALRTSKSISAAAIIAGCPRGVAAMIAKEHAVDLSHMMAGKGRPRTYEQIFGYKNTRDGTTRTYLRKLEPDIYFCSGCGQLPWWNGRELILQMDHIDGDGRNDSRDNLRWLCPNCHTQTDTFTGRNMKKKEKGFDLCQ